MALLNKGRLSVQRVEKEAWEAISKIANEGHDDIDLKVVKKTKGAAKAKGKRAAKSQSKMEENHGSEEEDGSTAEMGGKRKAKEVIEEANETRKSKRAKK